MRFESIVTGRVIDVKDYNNKKLYLVYDGEGLVNVFSGVDLGYGKDDNVIFRCRVYADKVYIEAVEVLGNE